MADNPPPVDKGAHTNFQDYNVLSKNSDGGYSFTPLTEAPGASEENPGWLSGLPILSDAENIYHDLQNNDKVGAVLDAAAAYVSDGAFAGQLAEDVATGNVGGFVGNLLAGPLTAWLLDHVKPLRLVMDELAGNPGTVAAIGASWSNTSKALAGMTTDLQHAAAGTQEYWKGAAADSYRTGKAANLAKALGTASVLCEAWGLAVKLMGEVVKAVHDAVRDLIAQLVALIVEICINLVAETPAGAVAELALDAGPDITKVFAIVFKLLTGVGEALETLLASIARIATVISELYKLFSGEAAAHR
ncbi:WXG100 family type VII secretion target [Amycolatopsis sp. VS8301801F10]|uniref:WXG100 family type VII secretion target n=1 Tax=Amycolatopsis sp. VS8301801F10 TaxID=2652442 RepID=UPI0038FCE8CF